MDQGNNGDDDATMMMMMMMTQRENARSACRSVLHKDQWRGRVVVMMALVTIGSPENVNRARLPRYQLIWRDRRGCPCGVVGVERLSKV